MIKDLLIIFGTLILGVLCIVFIEKDKPSSVKFTYLKNKFAKLAAYLFNRNVFTDGDVYSKKINFDNYYEVAVVCKNCTQPNTVYVKKGVHINDVIFGAKCKNCNCRLEKI